MGCISFYIEKRASLLKELDILIWYGRNDSLRIAYVHEAKQIIDGKPYTEYSSKLVKADPSGKDQVKGNSTRYVLYGICVFGSF